MSTPEPHGQADESCVHSLDGVAEITQTSRHLIAVYCRYGLVSPLDEAEHGGWAFDDEAVGQLRRLERLRSVYGVNVEGLRHIEELRHEVEILRREVRFLRGSG